MSLLYHRLYVISKASYFIIIIQQFIFQFNQKRNILLFGKQNLWRFKLAKVNRKNIDKKVKIDKTINYCDVITHQMMSYIINFILQTFHLPYNEDLLRLECENSSSYINEVKPLFRVEIGASEEKGDISKIREKNFLICHVPKTN